MSPSTKPLNLKASAAQIAPSEELSPIPWWVKRLLRGIRKLDTLQAVQTRAKHLTPYEMHTLLNPEELGLAVEERLSNVARLLEATRNMAILIPIILTWLSLSAASDAYQQSIAKDKSLQSVPFLQLWQAGFPLISQVAVGPWHFSLLHGANHWFTFANFAFLDAVILGGILALIIIAQIIILFAFWFGKKIYYWMNKELDRLCQISDLWALGPEGKRQEPEIRQMISVLDQIGSATQKQAEAVGNIKEDVSSMHSAANKMGNAAQQVKEAFNPYQAIVQQMEKHAQDLIKHRQLTESQWNAMLRILAHAINSNDPEIQRVIYEYQAMVRSQNMGYVTPGSPKSGWHKLLDRLNPFRFFHS